MLVNDGKGNFKDIAAEKNKDIAHIGLVTNAVWANVTGDAAEELIIVGEWMTPRIFSFKGDRFIEIKTNLNQLYGWWQSLAAADIDGDGDLDLILGNIGENFSLKPDQQNPVKLWINDFDENNSFEKIISSTVEGKDKPVFLKRELTEQIPSLKKRKPKARRFRKKINTRFIS